MILFDWSWNCKLPTQSFKLKMKAISSSTIKLFCFILYIGTLKLVNINLLAYYCFIVYTVILEPTFSILKHLKVTQTCIFGTQKMFYPQRINWLCQGILIGKILTLMWLSSNLIEIWPCLWNPNFLVSEDRERGLRRAEDEALKIAF